VDKSALPHCGRHEHRGWTVVRDGFYGAKPRRRQRYRCSEPGNPANRHRFTPRVVRLEATERHCLECESPLASGQGPNAARQHDFAGREIAAALVAVATGSTYSQAAMAARRSVIDLARHYPVPPRRPRGGGTSTARLRPGEAGADGVAGRHGTLVGTWVETYTDIVLGAAPVPMPRVLLLDSTTFWRRGGGRTSPAFSVLFAYGYPDDSSSGRLLAAAAYRSVNAAAWTDFLAGMPGMPAVVVCDRAQDIAGGLAASWPTPGVGNRPEVVWCRWHLLNALRGALATDLKRYGAVPEKHPLYERAERAFDNHRSWTDYYQLAYRSLLAFDPEALDLPAAIRWLSRNELRVITQMARQPDRPGPQSIGALEADIRFIRERVAGRAQGLRNRPRTNQMLRLMVAGRTGIADERRWAESIRRHLASNAGHAPAQRPLVGAGGL
jgi:hypothetical protein